MVIFFHKILIRSRSSNTSLCFGPQGTSMLKTVFADRLDVENCPTRQTTQTWWITVKQSQPDNSNAHLTAKAKRLRQSERREELWKFYTVQIFQQNVVWGEKFQHFSDKNIELFSEKNLGTFGTIILENGRKTTFYAHKILLFFRETFVLFVKSWNKAR